MNRLPDWDRRLARVTEKHMRLPGAWGVSDCVLTVGEAVEAVTGENPFARFAGRYTTEIGAARVMRKEGFASLEEAFVAYFVPCPRLKAQRGDVGIVMQGGQPTACYLTEYGAAAKGPAGLVFHAQTDLVRAYRIGQ